MVERPCFPRVKYIIHKGSMAFPDDASHLPVVLDITTFQPDCLQKARTPSSQTLTMTLPTCPTMATCPTMEACPRYFPLTMAPGTIQNSTTIWRPKRASPTLPPRTRSPTLPPRTRSPTLPPRIRSPIRPLGPLGPVGPLGPLWSLEPLQPSVPASIEPCTCSCVF